MFIVFVCRIVAAGGQLQARVSNPGVYLFDIAYELDYDEVSIYIYVYIVALTTHVIVSCKDNVADESIILSKPINNIYLIMFHNFYLN
jgi:hypothetical protein